MSEEKKKKVIQEIVSFYGSFQREILDMFPNSFSALSPLLSRALLEIYYSEGITPSLLNKRLSITVPNTSRCLQQLGDLGYIMKIKDQYDKRMTHIKLTEKGTQIVEESIKYMDEVMIKKLSILELDELARLSEAFATIGEMLEKIGRYSA